MVSRMSKIALVTIWLVAVSATSAHAQSTGPWQRYDTENGEWRSYAGNIAGQKYSPLDQIDADNFRHLTLAWQR